MRSRVYLSPDSTSNTRRLGSSVRRAARTQPAVPAGGCCWLSEQDRNKQRLASSYDDDVVLGVKRLLAGRDTLEVFDEVGFLNFGGLEDEKGGDKSDEGELRPLRGGRGIGLGHGGSVYA